MWSVQPLHHCDYFKMSGSAVVELVSSEGVEFFSEAELKLRRPFKCRYCGKGFANPAYLAQHNRIHLGLKPYGPCQYCGKKFTQLSHLQQHLRTHTGERPYRCSFAGCSKSFSQLSNLHSHSRRHQLAAARNRNSGRSLDGEESAGGEGSAATEASETIDRLLLTRTHSNPVHSSQLHIPSLPSSSQRNPTMVGAVNLGLPAGFRNWTTQPPQDLSPSLDGESKVGETSNAASPLPVFSEPNSVDWLFPSLDMRPSCSRHHQNPPFMSYHQS